MYSLRCASKDYGATCDEENICVLSCKEYLYYRKRDLMKRDWLDDRDDWFSMDLADIVMGKRFIPR
jgi:hypothetical protein